MFYFDAPVGATTLAILLAVLLNIFLPISLLIRKNRFIEILSWVIVVILSITTLYISYLYMIWPGYFELSTAIPYIFFILNLAGFVILLEYRSKFTVRINTVYIAKSSIILLIISTVNIIIINLYAQDLNKNFVFNIMLLSYSIILIKLVISSLLTFFYLKRKQQNTIYWSAVKLSFLFILTCFFISSALDYIFLYIQLSISLSNQNPPLNFYVQQILISFSSLIFYSFIVSLISSLIYIKQQKVKNIYM